MTRTSLLIGASLAAFLTVSSVASANSEVEQIEEAWPEEVPTPWFCWGGPPVSVCVPPHNLVP